MLQWISEKKNQSNDVDSKGMSFHMLIPCLCNYVYALLQI